MRDSILGLWDPDMSRRQSLSQMSYPDAQKRNKCGNGEGREGKHGGGLVWSKDNEKERPEIKYISLVESLPTECKDERVIQHTRRLYTSLINTRVLKDIAESRRKTYE